jgi:GAF domain-containing protein
LREVDAEGRFGAAYTELQRALAAARSEIAEALEQQTATADILRVISSSPTDVQPVFDAIVGSATRLCEADLSSLFTFDGTLIHFAAQHGRTREEMTAVRQAFPQPLGRHSVTSRAIVDATIMQVHDVSRDSEIAEPLRTLFRTVMAVPLFRDGRPIGTITVARRIVRPFSDVQIHLLQAFADQAVIAIENVRLFNETKEALEQQTATAEILRVISTSPTDLTPVFDTIARNAVRVCDSTDALVALVDGDETVTMAHYGDQAFGGRKRRPITSGFVVGRTVLEARPIQVDDLTAVADFPEGRELAVHMGHRTVMAVPLLRDGVAIGAILMRRSEVRPFTDKQITLLRTFADQAVIAIENVRLFKELETRNSQLTQALEQQTATSEILRVISQSPTDIQPVLDAVTANAAAVCGATDALIVRLEGEDLRRVAHFGPIPLVLPAVRSLTRGSAAGRAIVESRTIHVHDILAADAARDYPEALPPDAGPIWRTMLAVPLVREGVAIGAILIRRTEIRPFTPNEIQLLETFASQAVIAIENVRLFTELEEKNRALTTAHAQVRETLEHQTATSEILRVIASSPTDLQPVFDVIIKNAVRLCDTLEGSVFRFDGELIHLVANASNDTAFIQQLGRVFPRASGWDSPTARAILTRAVIHVPDILADASYRVPRTLTSFRRTILSVPMLRDGEPTGAITVARRDVRPFSDAQVALLQTFADQAVIAIENVRLFKELEARTAALTHSVAELRALGAVGQALSSTLDVDVVLNTIVTRANDLIGADGCTIFEYDEITEQFHLRATRNLEPRLVEMARGTPLRKGDQGILGQLPIRRQAVQVPDITSGSYSSPIGDALIEAGYRAVVAVPLIREDHLIGALTMNRKTPGEFPVETIELLQTFATQSALAIQNARLFREIEIKSRQLEVASQHKSEFLANMSHELRTPLNAVIGFSEVLRDRMFGDLTEKQEEYLNDIHASGQHLLSLINDILDLSKIEAGKMELELAEFHLPAAVDNALTLVRERAGRHGIALHAEIDDRIEYIRGDERKIKQVLLNLLSNAIKFTPEGGRIDVRAALGDGVIEVSVTDTGLGIAPEDQVAIFQEFRQVGTAAKKVEGTGLGLALSRKFIELHGGRIWVKSQVGAGSTFTFTIPVHHDE